MFKQQCQTVNFIKGLSLRTTRAITTSDMTHFCELLDAQPKYAGVCTFLSDHDSIVFKFLNNNDWYKTVEFNIKTWAYNCDDKCGANISFVTRLKAYDGAPLFTIGELLVWEKCFAQIGVVSHGKHKYPTGTNLLPKRRRQYSEFV
jgi:hypothetical protein